VKAVEQFGREGPVERWRELRARIHADVCAKGWSARRASFVQSYGSEELDGARWPIIDRMGECGDLLDTAALVNQLDLVISVDTAVAHLAGALGKPVWMLNRYESEWRWMLEREDSPWYPTLRLFRQDRAGDWDAPIARIAAALAAIRP